MVKNDLEYYNSHADIWWEEGQVLHLSNQFNKTRFRFTAEYVPDWRDLEVLDIGCGGGLACEYLAQSGAKVTGIDLSERSIRMAKAHAEQNHFQINYHQGQAEELPYSDNAFDRAICFDVLEHVSDVGQVISEARRILKPGGILFFDTINRTLRSKVVMIWLLENILKQLPQGLHDWTKFITPDEMTEILTRSGFNGIEMRGFDVTNGANLNTFRNVLIRGLKDYQKEGLFPIQLNDNFSVCYIGKATKSSAIVSRSSGRYLRPPTEQNDQAKDIGISH